MIAKKRCQRWEKIIQRKYVNAPLLKCVTRYRYFVFYSLDLTPANLCKENLCTLPRPAVCVCLWEDVVIMDRKFN